MKLNLEEISAFLALLVAIITSIEYLIARVKKVFDKALKPINDRINDLELTADKNFLVRVLSDIEQSTVVDEVEVERFFETYRRYHDLGGNSYIDNKVNKLKKEGKL